MRDRGLEILRLLAANEYATAETTDLEALVEHYRLAATEMKREMDRLEAEGCVQHHVYGGSHVSYRLTPEGRRRIAEEATRRVG